MIEKKPEIPSEAPESSATPRELAEDTLQNLLEFSSHLEDCSHRTAAAVLTGTGTAELIRLTDGISTFAESLVTVKEILKVGLLEPVNLLETDLASILEDLTVSYQKKEFAHVAELLETALPLNISEWRVAGLPAIIRARDS